MELLQDCVPYACLVVVYVIKAKKENNSGIGRVLSKGGPLVILLHTVLHPVDLVKAFIQGYVQFYVSVETWHL